MHRIIDGTLYTRCKTPYAHQIKVHDLGHGQVEATVLPKYGWAEEACVLTPLARLDYAEALRNRDRGLSEAEKLEKLTEHRDRATRRARTNVRRLAKCKGLTELLTLTYRENMVDRDRMQRDLDVFLKRIRRAFPHFEYVCVFERQKRGAWHAHIACTKFQMHYLQRGVRVQSYALLRSMWRGVVGPDNGNVDVSKRRKLRSAAKLAAYLSKYIGKTFDQAEKYVNAYSASNGRPHRPMSFTVYSSMLADGIAGLFDLIGPDAVKSELFTLLLDKGGFFCCLSPPEVRYG